MQGTQLSLHLASGSQSAIYLGLIKTIKFHVSQSKHICELHSVPEPMCDLWPKLIEEIMCHVLEGQERESPQT